jgi:hypothetical protein
MVFSRNKAEDSEDNLSTPGNLVGVYFISDKIQIVYFKKNPKETNEAGCVTI